MEMKKQTYYYGIDILRFILSLVVVAIHVQPWIRSPWLRTIISSLMDCAVPIFFVITGYFLNEIIRKASLEKKTSIVAAKAWKIFKQYLLFSLIYLPLVLYYYYKSDMLQLRTLFIYIKDLLLFGSHNVSTVLWYLLSLSYSLAFIALLMKKKANIRLIAFIGFVIYVAGLVINRVAEYSGGSSYIIAFSNLISLTIRNGKIFNGFFYCPFGMLISEYGIKGMKKGLLLAAVYAAMQACLNVVSFPTLLSYGTEIISRVFLIAGIFIVFKELNLKHNVIYSYLNEYSKVAFYSHMYVWVVISYVFFGEIIIGNFIYGITLLGCLVLTIITICYHNARSKRLYTQ